MADSVKYLSPNTPLFYMEWGNKFKPANKDLKNVDSMQWWTAAPPFLTAVFKLNNKCSSALSQYKGLDTLNRLYNYLHLQVSPHVQQRDNMVYCKVCFESATRQTCWQGFIS